MIRGFRKCICEDCGHEFIGADVEYMCTAASAPVECPKCGSLNTKMGIPVELDLFISWVKEKLFRKK